MVDLAPLARDPFAASWPVEEVTLVSSVPVSTGAVPVSSGRVPVSTGAVPVSTGIVPVSTGGMPLSTGAKMWTEEQSRHNFEAVSKLVTPGEPLKSRLLLQPLATEAGGTQRHTGGKFWNSQSDPEFQAMSEWVSRKR